MILNDIRRGDTLYALGVKTGAIVPGKQIARVVHRNNEVLYDIKDIGEYKKKEEEKQE